MTAADRSELRRAKAHIIVDDLDYPELDRFEHHHLTAVLRATTATPLTITDGRGSWRTARLASSGAVEPGGPIHFEPRPTRSITIGVAIPKQDRPEWIVQKLTELGVATIALIECDRSVVHWDAGRAPKKLAKLRRTAAEALQQSRGVWLPDIVGPVAADALLADAYVAEPGGGPFPSDQDVFLIGPEGGWSDHEIAAARGTVDLGPTVLRVETAALSIAVRTLSVI